MANDIVQVGTFVHHGDFWFAGFMVVFVGLCLLCTNFMVSEQSPLKRCDLVGEAKLCLARQVPTQAWQGMLGAERNIEAPGTGLIGPYGSSLIALTPLQTASALYGLYSSAKAMAEGRLDFEAGSSEKRLQNGCKLEVDALGYGHNLYSQSGKTLVCAAVRSAHSRDPLGGWRWRQCSIILIEGGAPDAGHPSLRLVLRCLRGGAGGLRRGECDTAPLCHLAGIHARCGGERGSCLVGRR